MCDHATSTSTERIRLLCSQDWRKRDMQNLWINGTSQQVFKRTMKNGLTFCFLLTFAITQQLDDLSFVQHLTPWRKHMTCEILALHESHPHALIDFHLFPRQSDRLSPCKLWIACVKMLMPTTQFRVTDCKVYLFSMMCAWQRCGHSQKSCAMNSMNRFGHCCGEGNDTGSVFGVNVAVSADETELVKLFLSVFCNLISIKWFLNNDIDSKRIKHKDFTATRDCRVITFHGFCVLCDFLALILFFKCQGMGDEWGTIDQSNFRIHIVVETSCCAWDKELPEESMSLLQFSQIIGIWFVDAIWILCSPFQHTCFVFLIPHLCFASGNGESFNIGRFQNRWMLPVIRAGGDVLLWEFFVLKNSVDIHLFALRQGLDKFTMECIIGRPFLLSEIVFLKIGKKSARMASERIWFKHHGFLKFWLVFAARSVSKHFAKLWDGSFGWQLPWLWWRRFCNFHFVWMVDHQALVLCGGPARIDPGWCLWVQKGKSCGFWAGNAQAWRGRSI